tara:strand:+ start:65 stop:442 length:378 start_codon:yes stop_codon:yes gene_type:complete
MDTSVDLNTKSELFFRAVFELIDTEPPEISHNLTWDSLTFTEGYEKPPKEELKRRYQELLDGIPMQKLRETRDILLNQTDKYSSNDYPHKTSDIRQAWLDYRQALRDLPENTDAKNPTWPQEPTN